jgi:hypothetical protein
MSSARPLRGAYAELLINQAEDRNATNWGVLKIGYLGRPGVCLQRDLIKPLGILMRAYAQDRHDLPKRRRPSLMDMPPLVGAVEPYDKAGNFDPHLNFFITLKPDEEPRFRGFLRLRFGRDATKGADRLRATAYAPGTDRRWRHLDCEEQVPNLKLAPRPVLQRGMVEPSFDLQTLRSDWKRAAEYSVKQSATDTIVTEADLFSA